MTTCACPHIPERVICCYFINNMKLLLFQRRLLGEVGPLDERLGHFKKLVSNGKYMCFHLTP